MTKHTPGPWILGRSGVGWMPYSSSGKKTPWKDVEGPGGELVARTYEGQGYGAPNAHLIASAPDLLSACRDAIKALEYAAFKMGNSELNFRKERNVLAEAISRAEGRNA